MSRMSKEARLRLEEAVFQCAAIYYESPTSLQRLHRSRPDHFAHFVERHLAVNSAIADPLRDDDFFNHTAEGREWLIKAALNRLLRKSRLRKEKLPVPVLLGRDDKRRVEWRRMTCYWPATVLDKIANA